MARKDVENDTGGMDVVGQGFGTCGVDDLQPIGQDGPKDIDHLPIAARLAFQLALDPSDCRRQIPFLKRGAVAQGSGFAGQNR
jgi:hypothetical protein